jgi:hypothetical protein
VARTVITLPLPFPTKILYVFLFSSMRATCRCAGQLIAWKAASCGISLDYCALWSEQCKAQNPHCAAFCNLLLLPPC